MLFPAKVDLIPEEWGCKKDAFVILGSNSFKMFLILLTEVVATHMQVLKVQFEVPGLEEPVKSFFSNFY